MNSVTNIPDAVSILIQASRIGQEHGIFTLEEARVIADAIDLILTPQNKVNSLENPVGENEAEENEINYETEEKFNHEDDRPVSQYIDETIPKIPTAADKAAKGKATSAPYSGVNKK